MPQAEHTPEMAAATAALPQINLAAAGREDMLVTVAQAEVSLPLAPTVLVVEAAVAEATSPTAPVAAVVLASMDKDQTVQGAVVLAAAWAAAAAVMAPAVATGIEKLGVVVLHSMVVVTEALMAAAALTGVTLLAVEPQEVSASYGPASHGRFRLQKQDRFVLPLA